MPKINIKKNMNSFFKTNVLFLYLGDVSRNLIQPRFVRNFNIMPQNIEEVYYTYLTIYSELVNDNPTFLNGKMSNNMGTDETNLVH